MLIRLMTIYYSTAIISILNALPLIQYFIDFASIPLIDARQSLSKPSATDELNLRINARLSAFHYRLPSHVQKLFPFVSQSLCFISSTTIAVAGDYSTRPARYSQY